MPSYCHHIYLETDSPRNYLEWDFAWPFDEVNYNSVSLSNQMLHKFFQDAVRVIMHEGDINAMAYSVENRSRDLDRNLMELTSRIPSSLLVRNGFDKSVRRSVEEEFLDNQEFCNSESKFLFSFLGTKIFLDEFS